MKSPRWSSLLATFLPVAVRLEHPKPGARSIQRSTVQVNSFRSHAKHLQVAAHCIAAGRKKPNQKEKTPDRQASNRWENQLKISGFSR
jgi:hypothetical protein